MGWIKISLPQTMDWIKICLAETMDWIKICLAETMDWIKISLAQTMDWIKISLAQTMDWKEAWTYSYYTQKNFIKTGANVKTQRRAILSEQNWDQKVRKFIRINNCKFIKEFTRKEIKESIAKKSELRCSSKFDQIKALTKFEEPNNSLENIWTEKEVKHTSKQGWYDLWTFWILDFLFSFTFLIGSHSLKCSSAVIFGE